GEGEMGEVRLLEQLPAREPADDGAHGREDLPHVEARVVSRELLGERGEIEPELRLELLNQGRVEHGRFVARLQGPGISRRAAPQPDRNEQERREARQLAAGSLEPAEQTEGQIDGVGAPLLETLAPLPIEEDELLDVGLRRLVAEE